MILGWIIVALGVLALMRWADLPGWLWLVLVALGLWALGALSDAQDEADGTKPKPAGASGASGGVGTTPDDRSRKEGARRS